MLVATWNINSIRARTDRALAFLERTGVDVLALQETKCKDEQFPRAEFEALGYEVVTSGFSQWNGVAIASKVGIEDVEIGFEGMPTWGDPAAAEARAIGATCDGVRVWSLYVPNGREIDDPHYAYKLEWLARAAGHRRRLARRTTRPRRSRSSATGTSHRSTPTCGTSRLLRRPHARDARRARGVHGHRRGRLHRGLARARPRPSTPTRTGTTGQRASPRTRACGST